MKIGIIGDGAISRFVQSAVRTRGYDVCAVLVRVERVHENPNLYIDAVSALPDDVSLMVDCAGHSALSAYGCDILHRGIDLVTVSLGALADRSVLERLENAARNGRSRLHLASGAIGALDCLQAAKVGGISSVVYVGRKPPKGWKGSPAENNVNLDDLRGEAKTHFDGSAREAALAYPKNANVAAAVALAGIGFDDTRVQLIADPNVTENIHEIRVVGDFGSFEFRINGKSLEGNPRSSALAAMSVVNKIEQFSRPIVI